MLEPGIAAAKRASLFPTTELRGEVRADPIHAVELSAYPRLREKVGAARCDLFPLDLIRHSVIYLSKLTKDFKKLE